MSEGEAGLAGNSFKDMQRNERYFQSLIESLSDVLIVLGADGVIRYQSPSLENVGELRADPGRPFDHIHLDDRDRALLTFRELLERPGDTVSIEMRIMHGEGSWRWVEATWRNMTSDPVVRGVVVTYRDITERRRAEQELREAERRAETAVLEERNRIAREIHDTLAQGFTGIVLQLEAAEKVLARDASKAQRHIDIARRLARQSLNEARRSVKNLRPQALQQHTLQESLGTEIRRFTREAGVRPAFDCYGEEGVITEDMESTLLRICQEALANIKKHAEASYVEVNLAFEDEDINLSVYDNGTGFDPEVDGERSFGMTTMRERAMLLGGTLGVRSEPGRGTLVEVTLPRPVR